MHTGTRAKFFLFLHMQIGILATSSQNVWRGLTANNGRLKQMSDHGVTDRSNAPVREEKKILVPFQV